MTVESATYIASLDATYPAGTDAKSEGDDHIRLIKSVLKSTFPNLSSAVTASPTALNNVFTTAGGTLAGDIDFNNNDLAGLKTAAFEAEYDAGNSGTSKTIDWNNGSRQKLTMSGNCTLTFTAPPGVGSCILRVVQAAAASYNITTWPAAVEWPSSTAPTVSSTYGRHDIFTFYYNGTTYYGASSQNYNV